MMTMKSTSMKQIASSRDTKKGLWFHLERVSQLWQDVFSIHQTHIQLSRNEYRTTSRTRDSLQRTTCVQIEEGFVQAQKAPMG